MAELVRVRPAAEADVVRADGMFPDLVPDYWRDAGNARSFVAVDATGSVLGHCHGIDSTLHPTSRSLVLNVLPQLCGAETEDALLAAQVQVSTRPLRMKIHADEVAEQQLARRFGGVAVQITPPWRYPVGAALRDWAVAHRGTTESIRDSDRREVLELEADHYIAQHAAWSPAASREVLVDELARDHDPEAGDVYDLRRSCLLRRSGGVAAAGLLWTSADEAPSDGAEVSLLSRPYEGPQVCIDKQACLAAIIDTATDGDVLLIDSHVSLTAESAMMQDIPGGTVAEGSEWMAIVSVPVPGGSTPVAFPDALVPDETPWIYQLLP